MTHLLVIDENAAAAPLIAAALFPGGYTVRTDAGMLVARGRPAEKLFPPPVWLRGLAAVLHHDPGHDREPGE